MQKTELFGVICGGAAIGKAARGPGVARGPEAAASAESPVPGPALLPKSMEGVVEDVGALTLAAPCPPSAPAA